MAPTTTSDRAAPGGTSQSQQSERSTAASARTRFPAPDLSSFYGRHQRDLYGYARRLLRDHDLAEDVVQQAFVNTIEALGNGAEITNMQAWLHRCIRNLFLNQRRQYPTTSLHEEQVEIEGLDEFEQTDTQERVRALVNAVGNLPEHHRKVFLLAEMRGFDYGEIAAELDRSVGSVAQILRRARNHVREMAAPSGKIEI